MRSQERGALYGPEVFAVIRESLDDVCAERLTPLMAQHLEACGLDPELLEQLGRIASTAEFLPRAKLGDF